MATAQTDEVRYERRGAAAVLTIDRPARRNAVDGKTAEALKAGYERFVADDDARALVITGAGGISFCAGADLTDIESLTPRMVDPAGPLGFTRLTAPKPTIAAIGGWCLAGGLELALWCDVRIADKGSTFGFPERRWGVPLVDGGTQRLPRVVGLGRGLDLILTGRMVHDTEALAIGLVERARRPRDRSGPRGRLRRRTGRLPAGDDARRPPGSDRRVRPAPERGPGLGGSGRSGDRRGGGRRGSSLCRRRRPQRCRRRRLSAVHGVGGPRARSSSSP